MPPEVRDTLEEIFGIVSPITHQMIGEYLFGGGRPRTLAYFGVEQRFRRHPSVRRAVQNFKAELITRTRTAAIRVCSRFAEGEEPNRLIRSAFRYDNNTTTNVRNDPDLFAVAGSTFFREGRVDLEINCRKRFYAAQLTMTFSINDAFKDVFDLRNRTRDENNDLAGARPFDIMDQWAEEELIQDQLER